MRRATVGAGVVAPALAALLFTALFFGNGQQDAPLVWIGGLAIAAAAAAWALVPGLRLPAPALGFLLALAGLALWSGFSVLWSIQPSRSWDYTNRTLVYLAFGLLGALAAATAVRPLRLVAFAAAGLLALVFAWSLLGKVVPALYPDYGRIARLRSPVGYWNDLALLADIAVPLGLWLAVPRARDPRLRAGGAVLLYCAFVVALLTYSRVGVVLALLATAGWLALGGERMESLVALLLCGGAAAAAFGIALALPGISEDGEPRAVRVHDGWAFALVLLAAAAAVFLLAWAGARAEARRPLSAALRRRVLRAAASAAALALAAIAVAAGLQFDRLWNEFANAPSAQVVQGPQRFGTVSSSNRWRWWSEAWEAWVDHPLRGTGAGSFALTDRLVRRNTVAVVEEPHNTPLQFASELGLVGFLLFLGAAACAAWGAWRARSLAGPDAGAATALALGVWVWLLHLVFDMDWSFVAACALPLALAGTLAAAGSERAAVRVRGRLALAGAAALALVAIYSLASPWLADRQVTAAYDAIGRGDAAAAAASAETAHALDPLSVDALVAWAQAEEVRGNDRRARTLYRRATRLEPKNPETWYGLGAFEFETAHDFRAALAALSESYRLDSFGPTSERCGIFDVSKRIVLGYGPSCPAQVQAARRAAARDGVLPAAAQP